MCKKKNDILPSAGQLHCHCGSPAMLRPANEVCKSAKEGAMAYMCARYPVCDSYVMAHPGNLEPMGSLAGPELRKLRREAHVNFNRLYTSGLMSKRTAYQWLAYITQSPMSHAHIGYMGDYYCKVIIEESRKLLLNRFQHARGQASGGERYVGAH